MLLDLWEDILQAMKGGGTAGVLLGVDYEKAFNRMEHGVCLDQLRALSASPGSLALVRAFLENRQMTIIIEGHHPKPVPIRRGSPQGSVLGCLLYRVTTQLLTSDLRGRRLGQEMTEPNGGSAPAAYLYVDDTTLFDAVSTNRAVLHLSMAPPTAAFKDLHLQSDLKELKRKAEEINMKINEKKTQLLVISPPNGCHLRLHRPWPRDQNRVC